MSPNISGVTLQSDPNNYLNSIIATANSDMDQEMEESYTPDARTELDSHANMVFFGKHSFIFDGASGRKCNVQPFDPSLGSKQSIPICDGALAYDCPYTHKTYILIGRNVLSVPTIEHNLIPPFILREAGLIVNDTAKIHRKDRTIDDHAIIIPQENNLHIPLKLNGIFSFFHTRRPTEDEIRHCDNIIFITPDSESWDPSSSHYAENEAAMLDWEGNIMEERFRV